MRLDKLVKATVAALEDIKGRDIVVLDVRKMTSLFDKIVIATADSTRQAAAHVPQRAGKTEGAGRKSTESKASRSAEWILVDLGAVIVHIMQPRNAAALQPRRVVDAAACDPPRTRALSAAAAGS